MSEQSVRMAESLFERWERGSLSFNGAVIECRDCVDSATGEKAFRLFQKRVREARK